MKRYCPLLLFFLVYNFLYTQDFTKTKEYQKFEGYFNFYYDEKNDKIFLQVDDLDKEFLYVNSLSSGVGSNDIGLDRGQLGNEQVVYFKKAGNKLLLIQPNLKFRALTDNDLERKSVEQAFAKSVLHGFKIEEELRGNYLIDLTEFLMRDAHGVAARLKRTKQGSYSLDQSKSAVALERTRAFPKNVEFDMMLTFKGNATGQFIRSVAPNSNLVTVAQHHSFIELPDTNFKKRVFDPRSGCYPFTYLDYSTPVQESITKRFIPRHRLEKKNPEAAMSEAIEPLVYYLDNGTPEPIRSALLDGAKWWNEAFEAIGFKNAYQVKILPDDADPLDVRYNVIQWVHRSTRGWSYGASVRDPRTGEIIKGHVSLGSLRIRQDFLIAQALSNAPFKYSDDNYQSMLDLAIARIRQLSAHEIGHTLGFAHNFAASADNRSSVMDYPHPQFELKNGEIEFSNAYTEGIGDWDKVTIAYAYTEFAEGTDERKGLNAILEKAQNDGLRYLSDQDGRPAGGSSPITHLWDNGKSATQELEDIMKIREVAIKNFSIDNIKSGEAYSVLEDVFVPVYFLHRYQIEATVKLVGGQDYNYQVKGSGQQVKKTVSAKEQKSALQTLLKTLNPEVLEIPKDQRKLFMPRAMGFPRTRESFKGKTGVTFDALGVAETASSTTLRLLLHPERVNRLIIQKGFDKKQLGLEEMLMMLVDETLNSKQKTGYLNEIQQVVNWQVLQHLMQLAASDAVYPQVKNQTLKILQQIGVRAKGENLLFSTELEKFFKDPSAYQVKTKAPQIPDGSPIGTYHNHNHDSEYGY